jgi:dihydrofolate reductase
MQELMVDFIVSLDGYAEAEGWPGWWGLEGPEYLAWLGEQPGDSFITLMGATTYREMSSMATTDEAYSPEEEATLAELARMPKVVFSSTLEEPLSWPNTQLVKTDAVEAVRQLKREADKPLHTLGSLQLCRSLLAAGLVDRYRLVLFPVITGKTGSKWIFEGYPDVKLDLVSSRTFDGRLQLLEYVPTVLDAPLSR